MLPVIDLHVTDPSALYALLSFVDEQCKKRNIQMPCVTFDQQRYVLAYDVVSSKNMNIFVRLGGFHQIMSFLGSIGLLMGGSGLRSALETVYATVTVGYMFIISIFGCFDEWCLQYINPGNVQNDKKKWTFTPWNSLSHYFMFICLSNDKTYHWCFAGVSQMRIAGCSGPDSPWWIFPPLGILYLLYTL